MTEPIFEAPTEAPVEAPASTNRRGRPRSQETLARDEAVVEALRAGGPKTREQLAEELNTPKSLVYLALWRLSHVDPPRVEKVADTGLQHAWRLVD